MTDSADHGLLDRRGSSLLGPASPIWPTPSFRTLAIARCRQSNRPMTNATDLPLCGVGLRTLKLRRPGPHQYLASPVDGLRGSRPLAPLASGRRTGGRHSHRSCETPPGVHSRSPADRHPEPRYLDRKLNCPLSTNGLEAAEPRFLQHPIAGREHRPIFPGLGVSPTGQSRRDFPATVPAIDRSKTRILLHFAAFRAPGIQPPKSPATH